jgi:hypothetical protein
LSTNFDRGALVRILRALEMIFLKNIILPRWFKTIVLVDEFSTSSGSQIFSSYNSYCFRQLSPLLLRALLLLIEFDSSFHVFVTIGTAEC